MLHADHVAVGLSLHSETCAQDVRASDASFSGRHVTTRTAFTVTEHLVASDLFGKNKTPDDVLQVKELNFFDVVIDFILFDAFDDLESPPSSVTSVVQNRWLSNGFKETVSGVCVVSVDSYRALSSAEQNNFILQKPFVVQCFAVILLRHYRLLCGLC